MKELPDNRVVLQDRLLEYTTATLSPQHPDPLSSLRVHSVRYCGWSGRVKVPLVHCTWRLHSNKFHWHHARKSKAGCRRSSSRNARQHPAKSDRWRDLGLYTWYRGRSTGNCGGRKRRSDRWWSPAIRLFPSARSAYGCYPSCREGWCRWYQSPIRLPSVSPALSAGAYGCSSCPLSRCYTGFWNGRHADRDCSDWLPLPQSTWYRPCCSADRR